MDSFVYNTPTKVYFGVGAVSNLAKEISSRGFRKVLLHFGGGSIRRNGVYEQVVEQLDDAGVSIVELPGVEPNPKIALARVGVDLCRREDVDFILGVGGGSVADSCKAIALGLGTGLDPWEAIVGNILPDKPFPTGIVLTVAAAGSEMSNSCVMTNEELHLKRSANHDANRLVVAFCDPAYTLTVPAYQTAAGSVDIMMHTMERYLTDEPPTPLTDAIAVALLRVVMDSQDTLVTDPGDLQARSDIMWASTLSHNDLTGCGRNKTFTAHKIEHDLSGYRDTIVHGAGLAVIFPAWCEFEYQRGTERFYTWARDVWGVERPDDHDAAIRQAIDTMRAKFRSWGMPTTLTELGLGPDDYPKTVALTTANGTKTIPSFGRQIGVEEILQIYRLAQ